MFHKVAGKKKTIGQSNKPKQTKNNVLRKFQKPNLSAGRCKFRLR